MMCPHMAAVGLERELKRGSTELLILAEKAGYRIKEIPVRWLEDPDTRVNVPKTVWEDVRGLLRLRLGRPWRRLRGVA